MSYSDVNNWAGGLRIGPDFRAQVPKEIQPDLIEYGSFASPSEFADYELKVAGKSFFVNPWYLAEKSPVFAVLCFSEGFKERGEKFATIQEEKSADILELLRCICPCSRFLTPKPITANFGLLIRLADKFDVANLKAASEKYLKEEFDYIDAEQTHVIEMLLAAAQFQLSKSAIAKLIARAATFDINTLKAHDVHKNLSNFVVAALFTANSKYRWEMESRMSPTYGGQAHNNKRIPPRPPPPQNSRRHQFFPDPSDHTDSASAQAAPIGYHHLIHKTESGEEAAFYASCSVCAFNNGQSGKRGTSNHLCLKCCQVLCAHCETERKCPNLLLTPAQISCLRNKMPSAEIDFAMLE